MGHARSYPRALLTFFNAAGVALRRNWLPLIRLDEQRLLDAACRQTGLQDFGDDRFRQPLRILLEVYEREAALPLIGRLAAWHDTFRLLTNRLRLVEDRKRDPGIAAQEIRAPIFIVGLPRTGLTLLPNLLAQDHANRAPLTGNVCGTGCSVFPR